MRHHNDICVRKQSNLYKLEKKIRGINKINLCIQTHTGSSEEVSKILVLLLKLAKLFK